MKSDTESLEIAVNARLFLALEALYTTSLCIEAQIENVQIAKHLLFRLISVVKTYKGENIMFYIKTGKIGDNNRQKVFLTLHNHVSYTQWTRKLLRMN